MPAFVPAWRPHPEDFAISTKHVAIIGAGVGGLAAAIDLAAKGVRVTLLERAPVPGGKLHTIGPLGIDAGPTTLTMRWVFEALFQRAGVSFADQLVLTRPETLARHAWAGEQHLDVFADIPRTADAIGAFAGPADAKGYLAFQAQARRIYETLKPRFLNAAQPQGLELLLGAGPLGARRLQPLTTLWTAVGRHMADPRLHQAFSRYSTQFGTSPFQAPAAMMLLAHVEQSDTWLVEGGMELLAAALAALAASQGAVLRTGAPVREIIVNGGSAAGVRLDSGETIEADAVLMNGEPAALAAGLLGPRAARATTAVRFPQRSLSANSWAMLAEAHGLPLARRTLFFSSDLKLEFDLINAGRLPTEPTVTIHAQDRTDPAIGASNGPANGPERLLLTVNAPPSGDRRAFSQVEIDQCMQGITGLLRRCGLELRPAAAPVMTTPATAHRQFPASGGALYGPALEGAAAAFRRPGARTKVPGLYLAGGSTHPGPGLGPAALSARQAVLSILQDLAPKRPGLFRSA